MARRKRLDDHMLLVPGETVSGHHRYEIVRLVGAGAYAVVYAAKDELGRSIALKEFFPPLHPREATALKMLFERERYVLSAVSPHPLMPTFYEGFINDKLYYLAQEYIDGQTLDEIIARSRSISREWRLKWTVSLCEALAFLHGQQIVHHDLKPSNIKIKPEGRLVLLDFGAAQYFGEPDNSVPESLLDDELYGTEGYLPPELEEEEHFVADVRTDIFALGAILYEMVMGEPPAQERINERDLYVATPLLQRKDIDYEYVRLVTTALSYNTEYRYASARSFLEDLKKIAPPLALISNKNLYFGQVESGASCTKTFGIYNAGGGTEISGTVKSRSPWLGVEMPKFKGQRRTVVLHADTSQIPQRGVITWGQVDVATKDQYDEDGNLTSRGDFWTINCAITVVPKQASLSVAELKSADKLVLAMRKGGEGKLTFTLINKGEQQADAKLFGPESPALKIDPESICLGGGESGKVTVIVPASQSASLSGDTPVAIEIEMKGKKTRQSVPILIRPQSSLDFLKGRLLGR
jgi:serine/threonine-protein kinase